MPLSLDGASGPLSPRELAHAFAATGEVWAWIDEPCAAGRLAAGDAVRITQSALPSERGLLRVVDAFGVAVVTGADDRRAPLGFVRVVWQARERRPWALDKAPWRTILANAGTRRWRIVERLRAMTQPIARTIEQLARQPSLTEVEKSEADFYDGSQVVADYERLTSEGLASAEEVVATELLDKGARVLVVGCGTGRESFALAQRGFHVLGIDIAAAAIASARRASGSRAELDGGDGRTGSVAFELASLARFDGARHSFDLVLVASDVLCGIPGRTNRIAALTRARELVKPGGCVVMAVRSGRGPARFLLETPRAALRILGLGHREPGDRFAWQGPPSTRRFFHVYADDVELATELASAGLGYDGRVARFVVGRHGTRASLPAAGIFDVAVEKARVLAMLPRVERARRRSGPAALAVTMRALSRGAPRREPLSRARLRATIAAYDRIVPFGAGCYRRALLEMALDAGAAEEPLVLGLRQRGLGHAWVGRTDTEESFDWIVRF